MKQLNDFENTILNNATGKKVEHPRIKQLEAERDRYREEKEGFRIAMNQLGEMNNNLIDERNKYRDALQEIVDHGESDCYVIAVHALEQVSNE